jgi:hypothetical protein
MAELISFITKPPEYGSTNPTVRHVHIYYTVMLCCAITFIILFIR